MTTPLPPLPAHPKSHIGDDWTEKEIMVIEAYAKLAVREALERVGWKKIYTRTTYQAKCLACGEMTEMTVNDVMHLPKHPFCTHSCEKWYHDNRTHRSCY